MNASGTPRNLELVWGVEGGGCGGVGEGGNMSFCMLTENTPLLDIVRVLYFHGSVLIVQTVFFMYCSIQAQ